MQAKVTTSTLPNNLGKLLYQYLINKKLIEDLAQKLIIERKVTLLSKEKSDKPAWVCAFPEYEKHIDLDNYNYIYRLETTLYFDGKQILTDVRNESGLSIDEESFMIYEVQSHENGMYSKEYFEAEGIDKVKYSLWQGYRQQKLITGSNLDYIESNRKPFKAFRLPQNLCDLLMTELSLTKWLCQHYGLDLTKYLHQSSNTEKTSERTSERTLSIQQQLDSLRKAREGFTTGTSRDRVKLNISK